MTSDLPRLSGLRSLRTRVRCGGIAFLLLAGTALTPVLPAAAQDAGNGTPALTVVPSDTPASAPPPALTVVPPDSAPGAIPANGATAATGAAGATNPAIPPTAPAAAPAIPATNAAPLPAAPAATAANAGAPIPVPAPGTISAPAAPDTASAGATIPIASSSSAAPLPSVTPAPKAVTAETAPTPTPLPTGHPPEAGTNSPLAAVTPLPAPAAAKAATPAATSPPSQTIAVVPPSQNTAMPPALTPDQSVPAGVADIGANGTKAATPPAAAAAGGDLSPIGVASGVANSPIKPARSAGAAGPDNYYDSTAPSPGSPLVAGQGPRKINPAQEPGQKFVVAEKEDGSISRDAQLEAGRRALAAGQYGAAGDIYDSLYQHYPKDENVLMGRAIAYQHAGDPRKAAAMYDRMLDVDPQNIDAQVNILGIMGKEYPDVALRRLMELHDKHPVDPTIAAQIGVTEGEQGDYASAIRFLQVASDLEPNNAQHLFNLAIVEDKAGHAADAIKDYQNALETDAAHGGTPTVPRDKIQDRLTTLRQN